MHRSGTSLVANAARTLGAEIGKELLVPDEFNQLGYGEDIQVVRMHDALLAALDRPWGTVKGTFPLPAGWMEKLEFDTARDQLAAYLRSEFARAGGRIWAVKDPRMSMLLPLWFRLERELDFELVPVLCIRSPDAVAASVEKRDRIPSDLGRLIWLQFNAAIVAQAADRIKVVLNYDDWFTDAGNNLAHLAAVLSHNVTDAERSEILNGLVSAQLRHHASGVATGIHGTWQQLLEQWAKEQKLPPPLLQAAKEVHAFLEAFDPWRQVVSNEKYLTDMIDGREAERRELIALADKNLKAYQATDAELHAVLQAIKKLEKERDDVHDVADRHFAAYKKIEEHALKLQDQYRDLARRYNLVMRRFDHFPLSLMMPSDARLPQQNKPTNGDAQNSAS